MLKSVARRRLALKTSALGLAGTLALFVGSIVGLATPAEASTAAAVDKTMTIPFNCTGGPFAGADTVQVKITMPDNVATGASVPIKWEFVTAKATQALAAQSKIAIEADLDVTGVSATGTTGTEPVWDQEVTLSTQVPSGTSASIPAKTVNGALTTGATSVVAKPLASQASLYLVVTPSGGTPLPETSCTAGTATPASLTATVGGTGGGTGTEDIVTYRCTGPGTADTQNVQIKVELTMPTTAKANEQFSIGWKGTYVSGQELKAPTTGTLSPKIFPYATLTGITNLTSATGEGTTGTITAGQIIPLPTTAVSMKTTSTSAGTATVKPGNVNFGSNAASGTDPAIRCEVQNAANLKTYPLTVGAGTGTSTSPSPTPSNTSASPKPTRTVTATVTQTPVGGNGKVTKTPKGAAETGGGGELGPDGRMFVVTGSLIVLAAAVGGLVLRRRTASRG
ncbi:hypothetical protein AB0B45_36570 [Nonomuraea sp. NPDC049152]|uniref:hypothetical protein n=1 Tax=Nonomuraea sp. NPDC049152 TaxID=3154350 RepID=UPI0033D8EA34